MSRQCYICLESHPEEDENQWVSPCRCSGSLQWVHQDCLLEWVREHENRNPIDPPRCPQCLTTLTLEPEMGPVVRAVSALNGLFSRAVQHLHEVAMFLVESLAVMELSSNHGRLTLVLAYGEDEAAEMMFRWGNLVTVRLIGICLFIIAVNNIPWEIPVLRGLRKGSTLPFLGSILPTEPRSRFQNSSSPDCSQDDFRLGVVGGLLLTPISKIVGELFFWSKPITQRFFIGGIVYLAVRGILIMYYQQKKSLSLAERRVVSFGAK